MQEIATSTFLSQQFLLKWKVIILLDIFRISEFQTASNFFFFFFFFEVSDVQWLFPPLHSLYPLTKRLSKHVSTIFWKGGGDLKNFFWRGGLMGKGHQFSEAGFRAFRDSFLLTLIWLTIYVQTERCITCYFSLCFLLILFIKILLFY